MFINNVQLADLLDESCLNEIGLQLDDFKLKTYSKANCNKRVLIDDLSNDENVTIHLTNNQNKKFKIETYEDLFFVEESWKDIVTCVSMNKKIF